MIKISFNVMGEGGVSCCVVADNDSAYAVCSALDNSVYITQWKLDVGLEHFPWYKEELWNNMKHNWSDWKYP